MACYGSAKTQSAAADGTNRAVVTDTIYDSMGRQSKTNGPYDDATAPSGTLITDKTDWEIATQNQTVYDRASRVTANVFLSKNVEQWRTSTSYGGDYTTVTPPIGGTPTRTTTDARGNTTELRQYHGPTVSGTYDATAFTFNSKNQLAKVTDQAGNVWSYERDLLGHVTSSTDPDSGTTIATYDDAGDLATTTDARGKTLAYSYDLIGRKTGLYDDTVSDANKRATWSYDTSGGFGGKGKLYSADRWINGNDYQTIYRSYNVLGQPARVDDVIPASETGLGTAPTPTSIRTTSTAHQS